MRYGNVDVGQNTGLSVRVIEPANVDVAIYLLERFSTVEINATFYRMPTATTIEGWAKAVPETFTFVLKAPQRITHFARLKNIFGLH